MSPTPNHSLSPKTVSWIGLGTDGLLSVAKVTAGLVFHSQAILADGMHSASDLTTDVAVLAGLRLSEQPPDPTHHYGHERINTLSAMFVGTALVAAAAWIVYSAINLLHTWSHEGPTPVTGSIPFYVAVAAVPIKELLYQITNRVGRRTGNRSLQANAWHHRTDAFSSVAAAAGLAGATFGGPGWAFLDPVIALLLSVFLLVTGLRILYGSASELIDRAPPEHVMAELERVIQGTPGVKTFHAFRGRELGGKLALDVHIQVEPTLTVHEGHEIASDVRERIQAFDDRVLEVIVHVEPAEQDTG